MLYRILCLILCTATLYLGIGKSVWALPVLRIMESGCPVFYSGPGDSLAPNVAGDSCLKQLLVCNKTGDSPVDFNRFVVSSDASLMLAFNFSNLEPNVVNATANVAGYIARINPWQTLLWGKVLSISSGDLLISGLQSLNDEDWLAWGSCTKCVDSSLIFPQEKMLLSRWDASGQLRWIRSYGISLQSSDQIHRILETADGGLALAGQTKGNAGNNQDFFVVKTDKNGEISWSLIIGNAEGKAEELQALAEDRDGSFYLLGQTSANHSKFPNDKDVFIVKISSFGEILWAKLLGDEQENKGLDILPDGAGNLYVAGILTLNGKEQGIQIIKFTGSGNLVWSKFYGAGAHMSFDPQFPKKRLYLNRDTLHIWYQERIEAGDNALFCLKINIHDGNPFHLFKISVNGTQYQLRQIQEQGLKTYWYALTGEGAEAIYELEYTYECGSELLKVSVMDHFQEKSLIMSHGRGCKVTAGDKFFTVVDDNLLKTCD